MKKSLVLQLQSQKLALMQSIPDVGVVCKGEWNGEEVLGGANQQTLHHPCACCYGYWSCL